MTAQEIIEKIRAEVKRRRDLHYKYYVKHGRGSSAESRYDEDVELLSFLDTLESEKPTTAEGDVFKEWGTTEKDYLDKSMEKVHLEMEIATYLKDWEEDEEIGLHLSTDNGCIPIELDDVRDLARHFAQWGAEHAKIDVTDFCKPIDPGIAQCIADHSWEMLGESEKPVPKDLEEAAVEYSAIGYSPFDDPYEKHQQFECSKFAFIAGAKWQKEQDEKELSEKIASAYQLGLADKEKQMMKEAVEGIVTTRSMAGNIVTAHIDHQFTNGQKVKLIIIQED